MKKGYTHIVFLLDKSGSMSSCWRNTIQQLNKLFGDQKEQPGELSVSFYTFNTSLDNHLNFVNVTDINTLPAPSSPGGGTSLYDAFCEVVDSTGANLRLMSENSRPEKVMFVLLTDGGENSSKTYNLTNCKNRLEEQRDRYSWSFLFIGADFNTEGLAVSFGLDPVFAPSYAKGKEVKTSAMLCGLVSNYRTSNSRSLSSDEAKSFSESIK